MIAEGAAEARQEKENTAQCRLQDVSEAPLSSEPSQFSLGGVEDEDLEAANVQGVEETADLFGDSADFSYTPLQAETQDSSVDLSEKVLKGRDLFLSKACEDDSDAQSDSPLASPFPGYPEYSENQTNFQGPSHPLERTSTVHPAPHAYSTGFSHFPFKRGRGRPRKDPFSPVSRRAR